MKEIEARKIALSLCRLPGVDITERDILENWSVDDIIDWLEIWEFYWDGVSWGNERVDEFLDELKDLSQEEAASEYAMLMYYAPNWEKIDQAIATKWGKRVLDEIKITRNYWVKGAYE
jgi:hypothetical protein